MQVKFFVSAKQLWHMAFGIEILFIRLTFSKNEVPGFEYAFVHQNDQFVGVRFASDDMKNELDKELERLNMIIADDKKLEASFENYAHLSRNFLRDRIWDI